jgi:hypothetical protein
LGQHGIDNALLAGNANANGVGKMSRRDRLGGRLGFYQREAA